MINDSDLVETIDSLKDKTVILYGAGDFGLKAYALLKSIGVCPKAFCVTKKNEETYLRLPVWSKEELKERKNDNYVIIISIKKDDFVSEIINILRGMQISPNSIWTLDKLYSTFLSSEKENIFIIRLAHNFKRVATYLSHEKSYFYFSLRIIQKVKSKIYWTIRRLKIRIFSFIRQLKNRIIGIVRYLITEFKNRVFLVIKKTLPNFIHIKLAKKEERKILLDMQEQSSLFKKKRVLVFDVTYRLNLIFEINRLLPDFDFIILFETDENNANLIIEKRDAIIEKEDRISLPVFFVPKILMRDRCLLHSKVNLPKKAGELLKGKNYLREASACFMKKYTTVQSFSDYFAYTAYNYLIKVFELLKPEKVLVWNKFLPFHHILTRVCRENNIDVVFYEHGVLPGTYAIERLGQMGESYPARHSDEFNNLPVSEEDLHAAENVLECLYATKLNRNEQPTYSLANEFNKLANNYPTIFYAGQNDYESGMYPYTDNANKFHSPIFQSSDEAAIAIAKIADKNGWNYIYKPHPYNINKAIVKHLPENAVFLEEANINDIVDFADVTVTILSTTAYVALVRKKAVVMLGYTQLKGKNCTYEAFSEDDIELVLKEAVNNGFTEAQRSSFVKHVAQLNKYYLYDNFFVLKKMSYAKDIQNCVQLFDDKGA